jgi:shikimate kinase
MIGKRNIYLVGPMGTGKTAVGRQLARRLGVDFLDSDAQIEADAGVDIPYIFEEEGEAGFREREKAMIAQLAAREPVVLATGGGAVLAPENRQLLSSTGTVVYLETSVSQQLQRVRGGRGRPLLKGADLNRRLDELWAIREPLYRQIADLTVSTDNRRVAKVVEVIQHELGRILAQS